MISTYPVDERAGDAGGLKSAGDDTADHHDGRDVRDVTIFLVVVVVVVVVVAIVPEVRSPVSRGRQRTSSQASIFWAERKKDLPSHTEDVLTASPDQIRRPSSASTTTTNKKTVSKISCSRLLRGEEMTA